ncbi:MAG: hypothetical protein HYX33_00130 [Actinobacteria bacterium]|nr:hypothetical protein [Actinomycetota bacterium]
MADDTSPRLTAVELATRIVAARVAAGAGRPNAIEGRETGGYFLEVLAAVRRGMGETPPSGETG